MAADAPTGQQMSPPSTGSGGFEFFRKYQKLILYTAGIFALLSFSITGALLGFFTPEPPFKGPTMKLPDGRTVRVTEEDWVVGNLMIRAQNDPALVLPNLTTQDEREDLQERFAALRRLAIEFGIDASEIEVDRAIEQAVKVLPQIQTPTQIAVRRGYGSVQAYRMVIKEALRVSTFLRSQVAGLDISDAALAEHILEDEEKLTLRVAFFDKKAHEEKLKADGVSDDLVKEWLAGLSEEDRRPFVDRNRVALRAVGLRYDAFDREEFAAELGAPPDEAKLRAEYDRRKARLFKKKGEGENRENGESPEKKGEGEKQEGGEKNENENGNGESGQDPEAGQDPAGEAEAAAVEEAQAGDGQAPPKPEDEFEAFEDVRERLERIVSAEAALDAIRFGPLQDALVAHMLPAIQARGDAVFATGEARKAVAAAEKKVERDPDNEAAEQALETAEQALEAAEEAEKAADEGVSERRKAFDFAAEMKRLIGGRKGVVEHSVAEPVASGELRELGPLGTWENAVVVETIKEPGDLSSQVQSTGAACFHFQLPEIVEAPLKPFEEIADRARAEYFVRQADKAASEGSEALEKALLEQAKAVIADKIAEIEKAKAEELEAEFTKWKDERQAELDEARVKRDAYADRPRSRIFKMWDDQVTKLEQALAGADGKRAELEEQNREALEAEIVAEARKLYKDVVDSAVEGTGFELTELPPYAVNLSQRPRFRYRYPENVRFLFSQQAVRDLEAGEVTDVLDDATGRALYLAVCTAREKSTVADLTRRQLEQARRAFVSERLSECMRQSFTMEALKKGWGYESALPREEEAKEG